MCKTWRRVREGIVDMEAKRLCCGLPCTVKMEGEMGGCRVGGR
jgi:hypothetical protein